MKRHHRYAGLVGVVATTLSAACTDSTPLELSAEPSAASSGPRYELVAGDGQSAPAGSELAHPLVVRVTTSTGEAVTGQIVNWVVTQGEGSVFAGRALTDAQGYAREWWTLGETPGNNTLEVRAVDSSTGARLVFGRFEAIGTDSTATEPPPPPATISISALGYKVKGLQKVDLTWSGATGASVEVYRNGALLVTTPNDGDLVDPIDSRGSGSFRYRVCEAGQEVCSGEIQVTF